MNSIWTELINWSPSFLSGFYLNLLISIVAMVVGTGLGWLLGRCRYAAAKSVNIVGNFLTDIFRNIPSFVFMFYVAFIIPTEFDWFGQQVAFPPWCKAAIALAVPVTGFASDHIYRLYREINQGNSIAFPMFLLSWTQYFLIIVMASSTASVIGVNEIVGRANTAIAVTRDPNTMLWIYLYVAAWFLLSATIINLLLKWLSSRLIRKKS